MTARLDRSEAAEYYFRYIDRVPEGDLVALLGAQRDEADALFRGISDARSLFRYAPGKWSIRELVSHLSDTERLFVFRAFWFARGFDSPLPSFEQEVAVAAARADARPWPALIEEFHHVRESSIAFYRGLGPEDFSRRGVASGNPFTVRALAHMTVGHVIHHLGILRERYLAAAG